MGPSECFEEACSWGSFTQDRACEQALAARFFVALQAFSGDGVALAFRDRLRLQPSGAYAANLLGLSEQVPAKVVFLTDGATRAARIGSTTIQLRRTTPRNMATAGRLSGLLIQALRALGKRRVTPQRIAHLKRTLPPAERRALTKDLRFAPAWMHPIFRELAGDGR